MSPLRESLAQQVNILRNLAQQVFILHLSPLGESQAQQVNILTKV